MSRKEVTAYRQCVLTRTADTNNNVMTTICWLDAAKAEPGALAQIDTGPNGTWEWWQIVNAGEPVEAKYIESYRDDYRTWRDVTDI